MGTGTSPTWRTTGGSGGRTTQNGRWAANCLGVMGGSMPNDFIGYYIDRNHSLFLSFDSHYAGNLLLSGELHKQQEATYTAASVNGAYVAYMAGQSDAILLRLTCSGGGCTVDKSDKVSSGVYSGDPIPAGTPMPAMSVDATGRTVFLGAPLQLYLYDAAGATGGSALILSTNQPDIGYVRLQGALPTSATGAYSMGPFGFNSSAYNNEFNTGQVTIHAVGNLSGYTDTGRRDAVVWGSSLSSMMAGSINSSFGYFDIGASGTAEVRCYVVRPQASGTPLAQSTNPLYGMSVCMDADNAHSPSNSLTVVQQIQ